MTATILTVEGHRAPPSDFVKRLAAFDPNLRVVWGLSQAIPFPGWVIERRIPSEMKAKVYGRTNRRVDEERYADQIITDHLGGKIGRRQFDMMPDWHPVYTVRDKHGPILELGEFVIDFLRRTYMRTLLGFPELSLRHWQEDHAADQVAEEKRHDDLNDRIAHKIMDHKTEIFPDQFAFSRQPAKVQEGTEFYGDSSDIETRNDHRSDPRIDAEDSQHQATNRGGGEA